MANIECEDGMRRVARRPIGIDLGDLRFDPRVSVCRFDASANHTTDTVGTHDDRSSNRAAVGHDGYRAAVVVNVLHTHALAHADSSVLRGLCQCCIELEATHDESNRSIGVNMLRSPYSAEGESIDFDPRDVQFDADRSQCEPSTRRDGACADFVTWVSAALENDDSIA
jgi:hypothetical protein